MVFTSIADDARWHAKKKRGKSNRRGMKSVCRFDRIVKKEVPAMKSDAMWRGRSIVVQIWKRGREADISRDIFHPGSCKTSLVNGNVILSAMKESQGHPRDVDARMTGILFS